MYFNPYIQQRMPNVMGGTSKEFAMVYESDLNSQNNS